MARVPVEDDIKKISNRFDLVMIASQRARSLSSGTELTVERDNDKNPVVALREIAEETIDLEEVEEALVKGLQKHVEPDEPDDEEMDLLTAGDDFMNLPADMKSDLVLGGTGDKGEMPAFTDNIIEQDAAGNTAEADAGQGENSEEKTEE